MRNSDLNRWFILSALCAALAAGGCDKSSENKPAAPAGGSNTNAAPPKTASIPTEPVVITPQELTKQFVDDSAAASTKYPAGTPFKITGVVAGFSPSGAGFKLKNEDKPDQLGVFCYFDDADQAKIKKAARGQKFTVIGKLSTYSSSDKQVELNKCKVAD